MLTADEVADIRAVTERLLRSDGEDLLFKGRAGHVANLPALDPIYFPLIDHPRVLPLLEAVMGSELILASLNARVVRPGDAAQILHGDVPAQFRKTGPPVMMNTIWLLDAFSEDNGATHIVPGSHRASTQDPPEGVSIKYEHQVVAPAGGVLVFNGQCWHGGGASRAAEPRFALFGHYRIDPWMRFECDPHRGFPRHWHSRLTDRQKALMRMSRGVGHPTSSDYDDK